jgi:hypothetical protein
MLIWMASIGRSFGTIIHENSRAGVGTIARQILPDESIFETPFCTIAFTAIAVPLVVVTIAAVVFSTRILPVCSVL